MGHNIFDNTVRNQEEMTSIKYSLMVTSEGDRQETDWGGDHGHVNVIIL